MSRPIPEHGNANRYSYGCRCPLCTRAATRADAQRKLDRMAGRPRQVPACPAAAHAAALLKRGLTITQIAREADTEPSTVRRLLQGQKSTLAVTANKILGVALNVRVSLGDVPATGAIRRVRALYALGHLNRVIAEEAGVSRDAICSLAAGTWPTLKVTADDGVRAAYDRLSMSTGTSWKTRTLAERNGWAPPLAWDDDAIDDPRARPHLPSDEDVLGEDFVDRVAVQQFVAGRLSKVNDAELLKAVRECRAMGLSNGDIDTLHGFARKTTETALNRIKKAYTRAGLVFPELAPSANQAKFTDEQVVKIREQYAAHGGTDLELSMQHGVNRSAMSALLSGRSYSSAGGPIRETRSAKPAESAKSLWALKKPGSAQSFAQAS
ncbi:hypothetical protein [Streptomyces sp. NPDC058297]|uniref:hypothetical protein n=1 Tax=Streptomyces sp. NPDC058297 TaxID=3346433 RepID=UPI0036EE7285